MIDSSRLQGPTVRYNVSFFEAKTTEWIERQFEKNDAALRAVAGKNYRARWASEGQRQARDHRDLVATALRDRYAAEAADQQAQADAWAAEQNGHIGMTGRW